MVKLWKVVVPILAALVLGVVGFAVGSATALKDGLALDLNPIDHESEERDTRVIDSVTMTREISLLSLGIQGIAAKTDNTTFLGHKIPGSERALFLQYEFNAKLGLDAGDVTIEQTGEKSYVITVPPFMFIGHDDITFRLAVEKNGVLSFMTPEIDTIEMTNEILNSDTEQEMIDKHQDQLQAQARVFYSSIVAGIDPEVQLKFEFKGASR